MATTGKALDATSVLGLKLTRIDLVCVEFAASFQRATLDLGVTTHSQ